MEEGVDAGMLRASLPEEGAVHIVGVVEGLDASWDVLQETPADMLVVACNGFSDKALFLIDGAVKQRPERPVVVLYTGSPNGFVKRVFEAGADDIVSLPADPGSMQFAIEKVLARRVGGAVGYRDRHGSADLRAGTEGRHRQDADHVQPGRRR